MRQYNQTILIAGGMGFVGSHFIEHLYKKYSGDRLVVVDRVDTNLSVLQDKVVLERSDVNNEDVFKLYRPDVVISFVPKFIEYCSEYDVKRYVQVLSWDDDLVTADATIRLAHCYGTGQSVNKFLPRCVLSVMKENVVWLNNDGESIRDWVYISDCCDAIDVVLNYGVRDKVYLASSGRSIRDRDIARMILEKFELPLSFIEYRDNVVEMVVDYSIDEKYDRVPNWKTKVEFEDGLDIVIKKLVSDSCS
jgi:dTDP-D-glucose 4,6-dehydratase